MRALKCRRLRAGVLVPSSSASINAATPGTQQGLHTLTLKSNEKTELSVPFDNSGSFLKFSTKLLLMEEANYFERLRGYQGAWGWPTFPVKGPDNKCFSLVGGGVSRDLRYNHTQLCKYPEEAATDTDQQTCVAVCQ